MLRELRERIKGVKEIEDAVVRSPRFLYAPRRAEGSARLYVFQYVLVTLFLVFGGHFDSIWNPVIQQLAFAEEVLDCRPKPVGMFHIWQVTGVRNDHLGGAWYSCRHVVGGQSQVGQVVFTDDD